MKQRLTKLASLGLALICVVSCVFALSACGGKKERPKDALVNAHVMAYQSCTGDLYAKVAGTDFDDADFEFCFATEVDDYATTTPWVSYFAVNAAHDGEYSMIAFYHDRVPGNDLTPENVPTELADYVGKQIKVQARVKEDWQYQASATITAAPYTVLAPNAVELKFFEKDDTIVVSSSTTPTAQLDNYVGYKVGEDIIPDAKEVFVTLRIGNGTSLVSAAFDYYYLKPGDGMLPNALDRAYGHYEDPNADYLFKGTQGAMRLPLRNANGTPSEYIEQGNGHYYIKVYVRLSAGGTLASNYVHQSICLDSCFA